MNIPIERARNRRPITWLTILGIVLLPAVIGGILVVALYNPTERLDAVNAAIVNEDDPVTIDGQYVPLGRQLTAGLVEGSDDIASNIDWTISNAEDAAQGLADGTYAAVVTIPENFSAAATSTRPGETPEKATIEVTTPPDSLIVDDAITAQITTTAATLTGQQLSTAYLENVLLGFTTLGDQLGEAADGADQLADGMRQSGTGAAELATGLEQLGSGAGELASGLGAIADGTQDAASGAGQLAAAQTQVADSLTAAPLPGAAEQMLAETGKAAAATVSTAQSAGALAATLGALAATCDGTTDYCDKVDEAAIAAASTAAGAGDAAKAAGTANGYAQQVVPGISALISQTSAGLRELSTQTQNLSNGLGQLASGTTQSQAGAQGLQSGASQAATGATALADGNTQLADGTAELASGLHTAATSLPAYTDAEATTLAEVVADPVQTEGVGTNLFGASAVPLLTALALWFGALGTFVALRAIPVRTLTSRAPSALLALRSFAPAAAIGAAQGLLVAGIVQVSAGYDWADWTLFAGVSIAAGVAFAAVNQALVAVLGGAGRWVSALVGVLAVATGIVSTVPGVLSSVASLMPTSPAYNAMIGALTGSGGIGAGIAGLAIWGGLAFGITVLAVVAKRTTTARAVIAAPAAS